nr:hypothetical protein [Dactylosporangium roseum]
MRRSSRLVSTLRPYRSSHPASSSSRDPARADPGDRLQRRPQGLPDRLDPVQPPHPGDHVRGVRSLPATSADQPGGLEPVEHQFQQRVRAFVDDQPGPELGEYRRVEPGVVEVQAQGVLPGNAVGHRLRRVGIGQVVPKLQDRHHGQQGRGQARLSERGVHPGEPAAGEVGVGEQRTQRVAHPHLIGPTPMNLPRQPGSGLRDLRYTGSGTQQRQLPRDSATSLKQDRPSLSHKIRNRLRQWNHGLGLARLGLNTDRRGDDRAMRRITLPGMPVNVVHTGNLIPEASRFPDRPTSGCLAEREPVDA